MRVLKVGQAALGRLFRPRSRTLGIPTAQAHAKVLPCSACLLKRHPLATKWAAEAAAPLERTAMKWRCSASGGGVRRRTPSRGAETPCLTRRFRSFVCIACGAIDQPTEVGSTLGSRSSGADFSRPLALVVCTTSISLWILCFARLESASGFWRLARLNSAFSSLALQTRRWAR